MRQVEQMMQPNLLIAPEGIEMAASNSCHRKTCSLLIAPEGIEIAISEKISELEANS